VVREEREPIIGGIGGGESPEARRYDEVREERIDRREDMVAEDVAELEMPGRNGGGVESPAAKAYDDVREERMMDVEKREAMAIDTTEVLVGAPIAKEAKDRGGERPDAIAYDDVREEKETRIDLNDSGLEPRSDYEPTGGERDARAEMRETDPDMLGATD
jgi:hypothetical protein